MLCGDNFQLPPVGNVAWYATMAASGDDAAEGGGLAAQAAPPGVLNLNCWIDRRNCTLALDLLQICTSFAASFERACNTLRSTVAVGFINLLPTLAGYTWHWQNQSEHVTLLKTSPAEVELVELVVPVRAVNV
jgi:hypothetical protein